MVAGISGDSGKTLVTVGLIAALKRRGHNIAAFKKGPDFIDSAWLKAASGGSVRNLDTYLVPKQQVYETFTNNALESGINLIEGNRGLYDGFDIHGTHSTAELAVLLRAPVVLVCNATKTTRTMAAIVLGMKAMASEPNIACVIINQTAGERHKGIVTKSVENIAGIPVLGAIPRVKGKKLLPSRHLGLVTPAESSQTSEMIDYLGQLVGENVDLDRLIKIAGESEKLAYQDIETPRIGDKSVKVGYFADSAFTFYYPENLESLDSCGAELIPISSLENTALPNVDALYIGGGFPETHAERLAANRSLMISVKQMAERGLPIYAECGGLVYLCQSLTIDQTTYPMAGVFDVDLAMKKSPQGHGYSIMEVDVQNPFFSIGKKLRGHEFHYTTPTRIGLSVRSVLAVRRGSGFSEGRDGILKGNVWASYLHIHAAGEKAWAKNFVGLAKAVKIHGQNSQSFGGWSLMNSMAIFGGGN